MKTSWKLGTLLVFVIALSPSPVLANAGTPLMWTGVAHLFIGNAVIGIVEGLLFSKFFHTPRSKSVNLLVVANYTSAWVGMFLILNRLFHIPSITLESWRVLGWI